MRVIFIIKLGLFFVLSCKEVKIDHEPIKMSKITKVKFEQGYISIDSNSIPQRDVNSSLKNGDFRFVAIMAFTIEVPGVPDYRYDFATKHNLKIISGTGDTFSYKGERNIAFQLFAKKYATEYNELLLRYLDQK